MADPADIANEYLAGYEAYAVATSRKPVPAIKPTGQCHSPACGDDVPGQQLYCNADCASEHDRLMRKG